MFISLSFLYWGLYIVDEINKKSDLIKNKVNLSDDKYHVEAGVWTWNV